MTKVIIKRELRTNHEGGSVLDLIYDDGTKRKLDLSKLQDKKTRLVRTKEALVHDESIVDDEIKQIEDEVKK